jgi:fumarate hydratase subunit alpha
MPLRHGGVMRTIETSLIADAAADMCARAAVSPAPGIREALELAFAGSVDGPAREALGICLENIDIAARRGVPLCQDTGVPVFFVELGVEVSVRGGTVESAICGGVARACRSGFLRPSLVRDPAWGRINTGDSTPPVIHFGTTAGDRLRMGLVLRGAGTENAGRASMLPPHSGESGIIDFVLETVSSTGAAACPPLVVSVGIGGNLEHCAMLAKKGLMRSFGCPSADPLCAGLERKLIEGLEGLRIGPQGFGGPYTALDARVMAAPCHMASLPVCVCVGCHALRTAEENL